jgi:ADP-heptose:LPS heptosyltransferase
VGEKRSLPLNLLIEKMPTEVFLVNLQYGDVTQEILNAKRSTGVLVNQLEDLNLTDNMDHFAATIAACDSIVSVDNSTVHYAGGVGQICRVLLPYSSDWRWGTRGEKASFWYPSLKLYWQEELNDWARPLNQLSIDLKFSSPETTL